MSELLESNNHVSKKDKSAKKRRREQVDFSDSVLDKEQEESSKERKKLKKSKKSAATSQDENYDRISSGVKNSESSKRHTHTEPETHAKDRSLRKSKKKKRKEESSGQREGGSEDNLSIDNSMASSKPKINGSVTGVDVINDVLDNEGHAREKKKRKKDGHSEKVKRPESTDSNAVCTTPLTVNKPKVVAPESEVLDYLKTHSITVKLGTAKPNETLPDDLKPYLSFSSLFSCIPTELQQPLSSFNSPTPIQACSWPAILQGKDVVGIAETGSGKTLAFGVPIVARLIQSDQKVSSNSSKRSKKSGISVLVLAPTRELALQTHETLNSLGAPFGISSVALFGGVDKDPQRRALADQTVVMAVGTPGRILDLMNEGTCNLSNVSFVVLDEADRMLDKGFENDIRTIISQTMQIRQTLMYSATWPEAVRRLASTFQSNPIRITVGSDDLTANRRVEQAIEVFDDQRQKDSRLLAHLRNLNVKRNNKQSSDETRILIFVLYKKEASRVEQNLRRQGFSVGGIHGDLSQLARIAALEDFKTGKTQLLVATDVAARGLDIPNVGTVINYSFPLTIEDYIHRIGRTGRGGRYGKSITFFTGDNHEKALAGELARVLRENGFDADPLKKFPMTIKKKTHSVYGAFFRDDVPAVTPTRITF